MLQTIKHLLSLIRFSHTLFALPFALLATFMAYAVEVIEGRTLEGIVGSPSPPWWTRILWRGFRFFDDPNQIGNWTPLYLDGLWRPLIAIVLCMIFARSTAMAFNRVVDR
ncbi:MAG: hypothetical protein AAGG46_09820, partial [Planctomycetota bacterium]